MQQINTYLVSMPSQIVRLIEDNKKDFIRLIQVVECNGEVQLYTFIALFREKGTLGQLVAFVCEWHASWGSKAGKAGAWNYALVRSCLEDSFEAGDLETLVTDVDWYDLHSEGKAWLEKLSVFERSNFWTDVIRKYGFQNNITLPITPRRPNDHWKQLLKNI